VQAQVVRSTLSPRADDEQERKLWVREDRNEEGAESGRDATDRADFEELVQRGAGRPRPGQFP
jgi:hypothetical protein